MHRANGLGTRARSARALRCALLLSCAAYACSDDGSEPREEDEGEPSTAAPERDAAAPSAADDAAMRDERDDDAAMRGERDDAGSAGAETTDIQGAAAATSCFGRCGAPELLAVEGACACDVGCLERGDCCTDKHEWCAAAERGAVCALTGPSVDPAECGTDLGWSFPHQGQLEILFGDSYDTECGVPLLYDDAQGQLPSARPSEVPEAPPSAPVSCGHPLQLDKQPDLTGAKQTFAPMRLFQDGAPLTSSVLETPLTGFSDGERVYALFRRGMDLSAPIYLVVRDDGAATEATPARTAYRVVQEYGTRHLQNPTASAVAHFDPAQPLARDDREGVETLFIWGRDDFTGADARALYLAYQALPVEDASGTSRWAPRYFAGLEGDTPTWSSDENAAVPVLRDDFEIVLQSEVAWIPELEKWIMLYGGDSPDAFKTVANTQPRRGAIHMRMADHPWGPWTRATPVLWREHVAAFLGCDAPLTPEPGLPSGCDNDDFPDDPQHSYNPGAWGSELRDFKGCVAGAPGAGSSAFFPVTLLPCAGAQRGNLYAPNLLPSWTVDRRGEHGYAHAATLYVNVSTWSPYQVVLTALTVYLP